MWNISTARKHRAPPRDTRDYLRYVASVNSVSDKPNVLHYVESLRDVVRMVNMWPFSFSSAITNSPPLV